MGQMNQHVPSCFNRQAGRLDDSMASPNDFLWTALVFSVHSNRKKKRCTYPQNNNKKKR